MRDFAYLRPDTPDAALAALRAQPAGARYYGGGTTLFDLMKLGLEAPTAVVDVSRMAALRGIAAGPEGLRIGASTTMAEAAEHPALRDGYPALAESLALAASQQLRNMATVGGNLLQRTRCPYFRGGAPYACNKREPGSGCAAIDGINRSHALLGGSAHCVAVYPGDWAVALLALDAEVEVAGPAGTRRIPLAVLHREPGDTPQAETTLAPGELVLAIHVPAQGVARGSVYRKVRDRESYAFALVSAACAVQLVGNRVADARIALGGVATRPWRAREAERSLVGRPLGRDAARAAATLAFAGARPLAHNAFKVALGIENVAAALLQAKERA